MSIFNFSIRKQKSKSIINIFVDLQICFIHLNATLAEQLIFAIDIIGRFFFAA